MSKMLIILAAIISLTAVWWWALFGISEEVGTAMAYTAVLIFVGGLFTLEV